MDFQFFESLSEKEAEDFLEQFLRLESQNCGALIERSRAQGLKLDYSVDSVPPFMIWVARDLRKFSIEPDGKLPDWIRNSESFTKYLFEFDDPSKTLILRIAYYIGASFVHQFPWLRWAIGNKEFAQVNMPVVSGFIGGFEMPPILIAENLFARVAADPTKESDMSRTYLRQLGIGKPAHLHNFRKWVSAFVLDLHTPLNATAISQCM